MEWALSLSICMKGLKPNNTNRIIQIVPCKTAFRNLNSIIKLQDKKFYLFLNRLINLIILMYQHRQQSWLTKMFKNTFIQRPSFERLCLSTESIYDNRFWTTSLKRNKYIKLYCIIKRHTEKFQVKSWGRINQKI